MWIEVRPDESAVRLVEPMIFTSLGVRAFCVEGDPKFVAAVAGIGKLVDGHVEVRESALRELAGSLADDAEWQGSLRAMLAFAASRGWVRGNGEVQAHIVYTQP